MQAATQVTAHGTVRSLLASFARANDACLLSVLLSNFYSTCNPWNVTCKKSEISTSPGRKINLTFFSGSHLAPKYFKVGANSKKLVVIMTNTQTSFTLSLYQID